MTSLAGATVLAGWTAAVPLAGQSQPPGGLTNSGAAFLLVAVGARGTALGQAAAADGATPEAAFWNPAGLASLPRSELALHYAHTFASNNAVVSAYLVSSLLGVLGAAAYVVDYGAQEIVPGPGLPPSGRLAPRNLELLASYATPLNSHLAFGVNYKLIQLRNDCSGDCGGFHSVVGTTHGVDVGLQYGSRDDTGLRLGAALRHAGFPLQLENADQADPLPTRVVLGTALRSRLPAPAEGLPTFGRILMDVENPCCRDLDPDLRLGAELIYGDRLNLWVGYALLHSEARGPSLGAGFHVGHLVVEFARVFFTSGTLDEPAYLTLRILL